jgi:hypothetical protein
MEEKDERNALDRYREKLRQGVRRFDGAALKRHNKGRVQGRQPFPIVAHCYLCCDNTGTHVEDNVHDGDEVILEADDDIGLIFTLHLQCVEIRMAEADLHYHRYTGGAIH